MSFMCTMSASKECDGCMCCKSNGDYYCPVCGKTTTESVFYSKFLGEIIGCENCINIKDPEDVLEAE